MQLWKNTPGACPEVPEITYYAPTASPSDGAVVIFPGGAYRCRAPHEGKDYAEFLAAAGIHAFVVDYRVNPDHYLLPLLDARRAVRLVRAHAAQYGIDPHKIAVMGSSAGGHLAATVSTYTAPIPHEGLDEIDDHPFLPDATILCYPVICAPDADGIRHVGSYEHLLGGRNPELEPTVDPARNVTDTTPPAFLWHTAEDPAVNVINSYRYATALREHNVSTELHVFPYGHHGLGLAIDRPHVAQWSGLLLNWLRLQGWLA